RCRPALRPGGPRPAARVPPAARAPVRRERRDRTRERLAGLRRHRRAVAAAGVGMSVGSGGRANQLRRTRKDLLQAAARLTSQGRDPSLEEIAEEAMVSRATAYRHFPDVTALLVEAALDIETPQ